MDFRIESQFNQPDGNAEGMTKPFFRFCSVLGSLASDLVKKTLKKAFST